MGSYGDLEFTLRPLNVYYGCMFYLSSFNFVFNFVLLLRYLEIFFSDVFYQFGHQAEQVNTWVSELSSLTRNEHALINQCKDLLSKLTETEVITDFSSPLQGKLQVLELLWLSKSSVLGAYFIYFLLHYLV